MRPSTRCCPSLSSGSAEMIRKYSVLWKISVTVKQLIKGASPAVLNFTILRRDSGSRVENVGEFSSCARIRLLDDCFRNAGDNAREWSIWYVFRVFLFGTYPCSDACYIAFCTTIIHCFAQIENLPPQHMEQQRVGNSALINIERAYANSVVIDLINDIFHRQNCRSWFLLTCFMNPYDRFMFMCKNIFTSHEGLC